MENWEEEFDEQFPLPDHERITKCSCRNYEEHEMHFRWFADPEEVKAFITTLLQEQRQRMAREIEGKKRLRKPTHGTCCTCQTCGGDIDHCDCDFNSGLQAALNIVLGEGEKHDI